VRACFARHAFLPDGWKENVRFEIDAAGSFTTVVPDSAAGTATPFGVLVPGVPNAHSHAFQRALAGGTEHANPDGDTFWTWREAMYAALEALDPDTLEAIAADAYVAMLETGYTHVCEFHYIHHGPGGVPYTRRTELADRIVAAARKTGIGLTLLAVFYRYGDFERRPPLPLQARFVHTPGSFAALWDDLVAAYGDDPQIRLGIAPHSLRAVDVEDIPTLVQLASRVPGAPLHVHVSEQEREVQACRELHGTTPIALLARYVTFDERWCFVHATHASPAELRTIVAAHASVALCPTTEGNLGDGIFPAARFVRMGGTIALGSDSNVSIDVAEELRWLEYVQRLKRQARGVLQDRATPSVGRFMYEAVLRGGAQAAGSKIGALAPGYRADFIALDTHDGFERATAFDRYVFRSRAWQPRDVVVGGRHVVRDGHHELGKGR